MKILKVNRYIFHYTLVVCRDACAYLGQGGKVSNEGKSLHICSSTGLDFGL